MEHSTSKATENKNILSTNLQKVIKGIIYQRAVIVSGAPKVFKRGQEKKLYLSF